MKTEYRIKKVTYTTGKELFIVQKKVLLQWKDMAFPVGTAYPVCHILQ